MYPYKIFLGMTLYEICIIVGVFATLLTFRFFADRTKMPAKVQNLVLFTTIVTVISGYIFAVLFQAFYDYLASGVFVIDSSTGSTFYGGFIGGFSTFIVVYFLIGSLIIKDKAHLKAFPLLFEIAGIAVPLTHGFGRLGCLSAGCCHGGRTDAWYGIYGPDLGYKFVPIQLYEAIFLFALAGALFFLLARAKKFTHAMSIYLIAYAVWRFIIEFFRADDRGETFIKNITPSQLTAIILVFASVFLYFCLEKFYVKRQNQNKKPLS